MGKVLVTGGLERKTLAVARCLSDHGHEVHVGDASRLAPGRWSRYCDRRVLYPSTRYEPARHLDFLKALLARERYDLVLPCSEYEVHLYAEHRAELEELTRLALPPADALPYAVDKAKTMQAAERLGIPHPKTWAPRSREELETALGEVDAEVVVVKPRTASGARGLSIVRDRRRLRDVYLATHENYPWPILQEFVPSRERGNATVVVLGRRQELLARFSYLRLREFPVEAGASTLVESVSRPDQEAHAVELLRGVGWSGLAMVEFRRDDRDGIPKLIEVNERLNASTRLSLLAGVPLAQLLYRLYVDGTAEPVLDYRTGVRCRWLVPGDLLHFLANPQRLHLEPSFFDFRDPRTHYEFLDPGDWKPLCAWLLWLCAHAFDPTTLRDFVFRRSSRRK